MYCAHFGLQRRPFDVSTEPAKLFLEGSRAVFSEALLYVLDHEKGFVKITGAVGSGKTTLLDAICLALYGKTPRMHGNSSHVAAPDTKDSTKARVGNHDPRSLVRTGTGDAHAEVGMKPAEQPLVKAIAEHLFHQFIAPIVWGPGRRRDR